MRRRGAESKKKIKKKFEKVCRNKKKQYLCITRTMNNGTTIRELSSVGSERLPYKQRVGGSTPSAPTKKTSSRNLKRSFAV